MVFKLTANNSTEPKAQETKSHNKPVVRHDTRTRCVLISLTTPLWICPNTMKPHENCLFCKCSQCYMKATEGRGTTQNMIKQSRRSARCIKAKNIQEGMFVSPLQKQTTAKTVVACDHEFLQSYTDHSYFVAEYIKRRNDKGHKLPIKCSVCNAFIVDKLT